MEPEKKHIPAAHVAHQMSTWEHVEELRGTVLKMALCVSVTMLLSFIFRGQIASFVQAPLIAIDPTRLENLQSLGVADSMTISLKLSFYAGLVLAFPALVYFAARFCLPALLPKERKSLFAASVTGFVLFLVGTAFGFFIVLPLALDFFFRDAQMMQWNPSWTVGEYYSFATQLVIAFGISFELPVLVLTLVWLGLLTPDQMKKTRAHAVVVIFAVSALITPTTDIFTLGLMALPLLVLYESCIWLSSWMFKYPPATGEAKEAPRLGS